MIIGKHKKQFDQLKADKKWLSDQLDAERSLRIDAERILRINAEAMAARANEKKQGSKKS